MTGPVPSVRDYVIDVAERAARTFAQTLAGLYGAGAVGLVHFGWAHALDIAGGAAVASILTSMIAAPVFGDNGTASFTPAVVSRSSVTKLRKQLAAVYGRHAEKPHVPRGAVDYAFAHGFVDHEAPLAQGGYVGGPGVTVTGPLLDTGYVITLDQARAANLDLEKFTNSITQRMRELDDTQEIARVTEPTVQRIPEQIVPGKRLGRHVHHDPRSLSYLVPETTTPTTAMWQRRVPVFDQGDLGSCTGNAAAGVLGTSPFYETLPAGLVDDEKEAVKLYSSATSLDSYPGAYPPDDTGSDGLSVAKAAQKAGLISGYQHITSVAAAQTAIKTGPFIVGCNWYTSMDNPDANGLVKVSGSIRGGHEFECHGYDAEADLWWFTNSWGASWGKDGTFCMSSASFAKLLADQGDATVFLPIAAPFPPAPPVPVPPVPAPTGFPLAAYDKWHAHPRSVPKTVEFIQECDTWLAGGGS